MPEDIRPKHKTIGEMTTKVVEVTYYGHNFPPISCEHCVRYFEHCEYNPDYEKNPIKRIVYYHADGKMEIVPKTRFGV